MKQMPTPLPNSSVFYSPWLSESALLVRHLINELLSVKEEGEKHPLPIFFSNTVLKRASHAREIPTKFRLRFESLRKHKLSIYCHPTFPF